MQEKIQNIIITALKEYKEYDEQLQNEQLKNPNPDTPLYGSSSALDSVGLVYLIADVEDRVFNELGKSIVLADEKAMSQKVSPFRNVKTLASYIVDLLDN